MKVTRKHSKKRDAILDAIKMTTAHPSAEMLYSVLKPEYPDLSLGTVYRNLGVFLQDGNIISVGSVAGQERYDGNTVPHVHFICTTCGRVLDIDFPNLTSDLYAAVEQRAGAIVLSHSLSFSGLCAECRDKAAD